MIIKKINISDKEITYLIGKNAQDNFDIIDQSNENDIWFHAENISSCHVILKINENYDKKNIKFNNKKRCNFM